MSPSILFDGIIYELQQRGGISVYFNELLTRLSAHSQFNVHLILASNHVVGELPNTDNLNVHSEESNLPKTLRRLLRSQVPKLTDEQNLQLFHSSYYRLPSDRSLKSVVTVHDMIHEKWPSGVKNRLLRWQKLRSLEAADHIIAVSKNTREDLLYLYPSIARDKVSVVYNGVSTAFRSLNVARDMSSAVYVGGRSKYKNFNFAVEFLANYPSLHLHIVGGGPLLPNELDALTRAGKERFTFHGSCSNEELNQLYNKCAFLIYPSTYEGFGIPPLEAMECGCVPVVNKVSSIPEVVGDAAIDIDEGSASLLAVKLQALNSSEFEELQGLGFEQSKKFSWQKMMLETSELYRELLHD